MTSEAEAAELADEYQAMVHKRTGIKSDELVCPREKSDMTPCIARDGSIAVAGKVCVGCGASVKGLHSEEKSLSPVQR